MSSETEILLKCIELAIKVAQGNSQGEIVTTEEIFSLATEIKGWLE